MRITNIKWAFPMLLFITASCSVSKKSTAGNKRDTANIVCADKIVASPHFDWVTENKNVLKGYSDMPLPASYNVYSIDSEQMANFFNIAGNNMQGMSNLDILIPFPDPVGCQVFEIATANKKPQDNMTDYVSITAKDVDTKHNNLFVSYNGQKMTANAKWGSTDFKVITAVNNGKTYYIVYQKPGIENKNMPILRQTSPANIRTPTFDR